MSAFQPGLGGGLGLSRRWRSHAPARPGVTLLPLRRKRRRIVGAVVVMLALSALFGWILESAWRRHAPIIAANATLELAFMGLPLVLMRLWILAPERILMDAEGFTLIRRRRRRHARWHEIADIVAHDGRYETASRVRMAGVCIRLKTPSGVPLPWVDLPDVYRLGREQLAALLQERLELGRRLLEPPEAKRFETATAAIRERDNDMLRFAALMILGPLVYLAWLFASIQLR
jgi:hypothetical protein